MTISKLGTLINEVGNNTKWIKFTANNKACNKWGLKEIIKEYKPDSKQLSRITYMFSENPLLGYQKASGSPEKMRKLWKSVTNLDDKESVSNLLKFLAGIGW